MPESVAEFFDSLPTRIDPSRTAGMNATYGFEIDPAGNWTVAVRDGQVSVAEGNQGADVTIRAPEDVFLRMLRGEQSPMTAFMLGKIKVDGDTALALKLQKLF